MKTVLSTKKLSLAQKELLLNTSLGFVEYDAISIIPLQFESPLEIENAIVTSQNGANQILGSETTISKWFCVGSKTESLLKENGQNVVKIAKNSSELGEFISKNHKNDVFYYFCGEQRRDELPTLLKIKKISFFEIKTYKTEPNLKKFDQKWDGILFFSPSGVQSYLSENSIGESVAFCIGETTANEARKHTKKTIVSNSTLVESVIAKAVNHFRATP